MQHELFNDKPVQPTGRELRDEGMTRTEAAHPTYSDNARDAIVWLASNRMEFTSDDLRELLEVEQGITAPHPNAIGAAMHHAVRAGIIRRVGYKQSTLPSTHARVIGVYTKA